MGNNWITGWICGLTAMYIANIALIILEHGKTELSIIRHACAHYDTTTGAFTWNDDTKPNN